MAFVGREPEDENPIGDYSSQTPTIQRETEEVSRDELEEMTSRQGHSDSEELDEWPAVKKPSGPLVERSELSEATIDRLRRHYHIPSHYRVMVPDEEGQIVHPPDGYIVIYKEFL